MTSFVFLKAFIPVFVATVFSLGAIGYTASAWFVPTPRERFLTPYMEMTLAPGWKCQWEGTEGVCQKRFPDQGGRDRATIAIFTAKYRAPFDTFACYEQHLRTPRTIKSNNPSNPDLRSDFRHIRMRQLGSYTWMDGLLFQSEIPNYFTQYLATLTSRIAILVTFAVHRDSLEHRLEEIESMVEQLKIYEGGGTARYEIGNASNRCLDQQVVDGYANASDSAPPTREAQN